MLTDKTTREQYIAHLISMNPSGRNEVINRHCLKVQAMNELEWVEHRAQLLKLVPQAKAAAKAMVAEILGKGRP